MMHIAADSTRVGAVLNPAISASEGVAVPTYMNCAYRLSLFMIGVEFIRNP